MAINAASATRPPKLLVPIIAVALMMAALGLLLSGKIQQVRQLQAEKQQLQSDKQRLEGENQQLNDQLNTLQANLKGLEDKLSSLRTQLSAQSTDFENARSALEELKARYERVSADRDQLQTQVATLTSEREEAQRKLKQLEQDNTELERTATHLRERMSLLNRDYQQLADKVAQLESLQEKSSQEAPPSTMAVASVGATPPAGWKPSSSSIPGAVELPPIIVQKDRAGTSLPVRGRLVDVNDAHNFIVVDKGSNDGVRVGMVFDVLRGAGTVGRASVVRVRPQISACDIIRASTPGPLQVGDLAVQSGS